MTHSRVTVFFLLTIAVVLISPDLSRAQAGLSAVDLTNVQSSDISDTQLRAAILRAQQEGLTIDQALQMAQARGLSASVASQLRARIQALQMDEDFMGETGEMQTAGEEEFADVFIRPEREETEVMSRTFGSQIFRYRETEFTPMHNVATPVNYTLGAGDELVINIWGDQTNTYQMTVNPDGAILIDNIGPVFVSGLTIEQANERILQQLEKIYSGLQGSPEEQTTFARVSLNRLRTIQVAVIGEASNPGDYTIQSNSTVFNALYRAGGPGEDGSYRTIRVIRNNEVIAELDLYNFLVDGIQDGNVRLRDADVIQVPPYRNRVEVTGEVKRSDLFFEVKDGETLAELLHFAGSFTDRAYRDQIRVHRNTDTDRRIVTVEQENYGDFSIKGGDVMYVDKILNRFENRVSITGAVWRSGEFELKEGMTLRDLILEAEGLRPDAFTSRGLINRLGEDYTLRQLSFDVSAVLEDPAEYNIPLRPEDHVYIRSIHDMTSEKTLRIEGAIRQPGEYNYRRNMTLEDLILQANGFTDDASEARIEISRRIVGEASPGQRGQRLADIYSFEVLRTLGLREEDKSFRLQPFDQIYVHRRPDYQTQKQVTIEGEVMYPGTYTIQNRNERISDLIERAGGLTREAYQAGARLIRQHSAIDRPEVEFDFLSAGEVVDEEQIGLMGVGETRRLRQQREAEERQQRAEAAEEDRRREEEGGEDEEPGIFEQRYEMNIQNYKPPQDTLDAEEEETGVAESRIGIDLAAILENPGSREDLFVRDGDVLRIPQELQTVAISGAVMQDVEVRYREGAGMGYYIDRAGGFAVNAKKNRVYIVYANGDVDRRKNYLFGLIKKSPPIEPGAHIVIPAKAEQRRLNTGELISISATVVGMTTSLIIALDRISR